VALTALAAVAASALALAAPPAAGAAACDLKAPPGYAARVHWALGAGQDVWAHHLLAAPDGPTYAAATRYLAPLRYAYGSRRQRLTTSGVYYVPFAFPFSPYGPQGFALHVADGSEIITRRIDGPRLGIFVGATGRERYGSCARRLGPTGLLDGYLPVLETSYVDARGVRYRQASFVARIWGTHSLVSLVRMTVDTRGSAVGATVRFVALPGTHHGGERATTREASRLIFGEGGTLDGSAVRYTVPPGELVDLYTGWVHNPDAGIPPAPDERVFDSALATVSGFWQDRLDQGAQFVVPDDRVMDAERSLLVQEQELTWRYSIGNAYEELSFAEAMDVAQVLAGYGYGDIAKAMLRYTLARLPLRFSSWRAGGLLVADALYYRLDRDRGFIERETPRLGRALELLSERISPRGGNGLLDRESFSSDISEQVYGLHSQTVAWEGLEAMGRVWAATGHPGLAARCRRLALRLGSGLRRAVRASERRLPDGSLFVPAALLDRGKPFGRLSATRAGTYWNLVIPYALASGFFRPHGRDAEGLLRYMLGHGSRLLGLVRADAARLYGPNAHPLSGTDQVYGVNMSRFLADEDHPDQLVLSLYGALAAGMTPGTFVSGEAATVAPLGHAYERAMYLPPNGGANAAFLETLRLMLVHETRARDGAPRGLELAFATARPWLADEKTITVQDAPTSFGPVSYSIERQGNLVQAIVQPPTASPPASLRLRLRLPAGVRIRKVLLAGRPLPFDRASGTIDLTSQRRNATFEVDAVLAPARR
jgi:hypothetical protein